MVLNKLFLETRKVPRRLAFRLTVLLSIKAKYKESLHFGGSSILEGRNENVEVHAGITQATNELVSDICFSEMTVDPLLHRERQLPPKVYKESAYKQGDSN